MNRISKKILLGLGFDSSDGHIRITAGRNFRIFGGSEETHEMMRSKVLEFNSKLDKMEKTLDEISEKEFFKIARAVGLSLPKKTKKEEDRDGKDNGR